MAATATMLIGASSATADAASITVWSCGLSGSPLSMQAWDRHTNANLSHYDEDCSDADGGASAALRGAYAGDVHSGFRLAEPPGTELTEVAWDGAVTAQGTAGTVVTEALADGAGALGVWTGALSPQLRTFPVPAAASGVTLRLRTDGVVETQSHELRVAQLRAVLEDAAPPTATGARGALSEAGYKSGTVGVTLDGADAGLGVRRAHLEVDGERMATQTVGVASGHACAPLSSNPRHYTQATPCAKAVTFSMSVDTTTLSDGAHDVAVVLEDPAGNGRGVWTRTLRVDNPTGAPTTACTDGRDNDADGRVDEGDDPGCRSAADTAESEPPILVSPPAISGAPKVGVPLTATASTWNDGPGLGAVLARRWQACRFDGQACVDVVPAQSGGTFAPGAELVGRRLRLAETRTTSEGAASVHSATTGPALAADGTLPACADGVDDDGDGLVDHDADQGCSSRLDPTEHELGPHDDLDHDGQDNASDPDDDGDGRPDQPQTPPVAAPSPPGSPAAQDPGPSPWPAGNGLGASDRAVVSLTGRRTRTVAHGRRIATVGRLVDERGRPIVGATLTVEDVTFVPGVGALRGATYRPVALKTPLTTDADGRFRWTIPAGRSRIVRVGYRARTADRDFTSVSELTLLVASKASLTADRPVVRNGSSVTFRGRLLGGSVPRSGVTVVLQARTARGWVPFKTVRAKRSGAFSGRYRFRATFKTRRYSFRAVVRADSGYPWLPSASRTISVLVKA